MYFAALASWGRMVRLFDHRLVWCIAAFAVVRFMSLKLVWSNSKAAICFYVAMAVGDGLFRVAIDAHQDLFDALGILLMICFIASTRSIWREMPWWLESRKAMPMR